MTKLIGSYEPHLAVRELTLLPGGEWTPQMPGWTMIQVGSGNGYWLQPQRNQDLETGTVLVRAPHVQGSIRASQLSGLSLQIFLVDPERLNGLITLSEQRSLAAAEFRVGFSLQILPPRSPVAVRMREVLAARNQSGTLFRLQLLQLFVEAFGKELEQEAPLPEAPSDARKRLCEFLNQAPASELLQVGFSDLVQLTRCTPRHLSRVFREVVGMSFREKHAELRLGRACELLAATESKVVDVALESGYQSLSLFNLMFTRRFGISPGRWRRKYRSVKPSATRDRRAVRMLS
jgi:AraC-like DNA-binding protein